MKRIFYLAAILLLAFPFGCRDSENDIGSYASLSPPASEYEGELLHDWMMLGFQMVRDNDLYGPHAARAYGYLGLAAWESVRNGIPNAKSMAGQINDWQETPYIDLTRQYDWGIVLCHAMEAVFPEVIDNFSPTQRSQVGLLAELQESQMMEKGLSEQVRINSADLGNRIGAMIVERARRDGRGLIRNIVPAIPARDAQHMWYWEGNTLGQSPVEPLWGTLRTFVIDNAQMCEVDGPYPYSTTPGSPFYQEALEVYNIERSPQNKAIAYHWENGPGRSCSPACHWVSIAQQVLSQKGSRLDECAKIYCALGFTVADAFSAAWYMKYRYFLLRPITYIRENIDPAWTPLVNTPPYPDYTSGSSVIGGSAPVILATYLGDMPFTDRTHLGSPLFTPDGGPFVLPERDFTSFIRAGEEQALSRIIGGVHFRKACEEGLVAGRCIGNTVIARIEFEK